MNNNLLFFNKNGSPINLKKGSDNIYRGNVYLNEVSEGLFENEQIFILEKVLDSNNEIKLSFPHCLFNTLTNDSFGSYWRTRWESDFYGDSRISEVLFTYQIETDIEVDHPILTNYKNINIPVIFDPIQVYDNTYKCINSDIILSEAMKIGVAINSGNQSEGVYQRKLIIEDISQTIPTTIVEIDFYGQIVGEDERFRVLLDNFGSVITPEDSLMFREHNPMEPLPNYIELNSKRKELLLVRDDIFNYIGAYKGLINAIKFFGYQDLRIKEYWLNLDWKKNGNRVNLPPTDVLKQLSLKGSINDVLESENTGKYKQVVTYGLFDGEYKLNLDNHGISLPSNTWKKTSLFSLVYDINKVKPDEFDEYGYPIVENNFMFDPDEVLLKLMALKNKLQRDFLPSNSKILDISGEGIYFGVYNLKNWNDQLNTSTIQSGLDVTFSVYPKEGFIEDLRIFEPKKSLSGTKFPLFDGIGPTGPSVLGNTVSSQYTGQKFPSADVASMVNSIYEYYRRKNDGLVMFGGDNDQLTEEYTYNIANPFRTIAGMPILLSFETPDYTWDDMNMTWDQISLPFNTEVQNINGIDVEIYIPDPSQKMLTWDSIKYSNFYEIEWTIKKVLDSGSPYYFNIRGSIYDYAILPHFLPYTGVYNVTCKVYDANGHVSSTSIFSCVEVKPHDIDLKLWTKYNENSEYTWENTIKPWDSYKGTWNYISEGESIDENRFPSEIFDFSNYQKGKNREEFRKIEMYTQPNSSKANFIVKIDSNTINEIYSKFLNSNNSLSYLFIKTTLLHNLSDGDVIRIEGSMDYINGLHSVTVIDTHTIQIDVILDISQGYYSKYIDVFNVFSGYKISSDFFPSQNFVKEGTIEIIIKDTNNKLLKSSEISGIYSLNELGYLTTSIFNSKKTSPFIIAKYELNIDKCEISLLFDKTYGNKYNNSSIEVIVNGCVNLHSSDSIFINGKNEEIGEYLYSDLINNENLPSSILKLRDNVTLESLSKNQISEMYAQTWSSYEFNNDYIGGFEIHNIKQGDILNIRGVSGGSLGVTGSTLNNIIDNLNNTINAGVSDFSYSSNYPYGFEVGITGISSYNVPYTNSLLVPPTVPGSPIYPIADFSSSATGATLGTSITFSDLSINGPITAWEWEFEGGSTTGATSSNPSVKWNNVSPENGFTVSLTTYNSYGPSYKKIKNNYIKIT